MKNKVYFTSHDIGCLIDESCGTAEDLNLRTIALARQCGAKLGRLPSVRNEDYDQIVSEIADSAVDALNCLPNLPDYCSFFFEDNSLFFAPSVENAREDCPTVSSNGMRDSGDVDEVKDPNFRGNWLSVNDHGNATLYCRDDAGQDVVIWSVV